MEEVKNTQPSYKVHFECSLLAAMSMADPTCAELNTDPHPGTWVSHPLSTGGTVHANGVAQELWHTPTSLVCSPALLCLQGWWSLFQSTVTAAMPCATCTKLLQAQDLHFPKPAHSSVQLTECIHSLTCGGVVGDITAAGFLWPD